MTVAFVPLLNEDEFLDEEITWNELQNVLFKTKDGKAPGTDGIPAEFFKYGPDELDEQILSLFNVM